MKTEKMSQPIYILGPCAAESREQVLACAQQLVESTPQMIFRAGVWKPRTNPHSFQGAGAVALDWLREVKDTYGIPVATEVATTEHLKLAKAAGIDYLWIGARTSADPIAVQELANELDGNETILIKNPTNEDTALWLGNIHRIEATGARVMAIHRGCNHRPCWRMAYDLRQARPDIPLLLDPSHLSGDSEQVLPLCQKAMELGLDGVMVEIHPQPEQALSDNKQQIKPKEWMYHVQSTMYKGCTKEEGSTKLSWLRSMIDEEDDAIWEAIARRMAVAREIGEYKKNCGMEVIQPQRFEEILQKRLQWSSSSSTPIISAETIRAIMAAIHEESIRQQK